MVRPPSSNTAVAAVPVTEVGPAPLRRTGAGATATPAPPATTRRATRRASRWRRTSAASRQAATAPHDQAGQQQGAEPEREQVDAAEPRVGPRGARSGTEVQAATGARRVRG